MLDRKNAPLQDANDDDDVELGDEEEPKDLSAAKEVNADEPTMVKFRSCKLDMSQVFPELMCPLGHMNETKYEQALKMGRIDKNG